MALRTITPGHKDLHGVSIHFTSCSSSSVQSPLNVRQIIGDETYMKWMGLDQVLVQLSESHAICVGVGCLREEGRVREYVGGLLPVATQGGMIRLVGYADL